MPTEMIKNLILLGPEVTIVAFLIALFLLDAFFGKTRETYIGMWIVVLACLCGAFVTLRLGAEPKQTFFGGMVTHDGFSNFFRVFFFFAAAVSAWLGFGSKELEKQSRNEFCLLLLCVLFGMSTMAISSHLLVLYLAIETVSIISFVMAGFKREDLRSSEASFKYLVYGAFASGIMLYGISLIYGLTGSLQYGEIAKFLTADSSSYQLPLLLALVMTLAGFAYKVSAFPFHYWTPDVYEGAPTPIVAFFSVGPKAAGFAALIRFVFEVLAHKTSETQWGLSVTALTPLLAGLSVATMVVGNLSALSQTNVKRIMAYSSIAHVGYMLMGIVTLNQGGLSAVLFYILVYGIMNLGAFWVVSMIADATGGDDLKHFKGMGWAMPVMGTCMAIFLFSLTGLPFFAGFIGKFLLFGALVNTPGLLWLALIGVLNSVVSLYYYAVILRAMFFEQAEGNAGGAVAVSVPQTMGVLMLAIPTVVLGLYFSPVITWIQRSLVGF